MYKHKYGCYCIMLFFLWMVRQGRHGGEGRHGAGQAGYACNAWHQWGSGQRQLRRCSRVWSGGRRNVGLAHTLLHVAFQHVASFELPTAELAGIGGGDAALVALVADQRGLVQVGAAAPLARVFVADGVAARLPQQRRLLLHQVPPRQSGLIHQGREDRTFACQQQSQH